MFDNLAHCQSWLAVGDHFQSCFLHFLVFGYRGGYFLEKKLVDNSFQNLPLKFLQDSIIGPLNFKNNQEHNFQGPSGLDHWVNNRPTFSFVGVKRSVLQNNRFVACIYWLVGRYFSALKHFGSIMLKRSVFVCIWIGKDLSVLYSMI